MKYSEVNSSEYLEYLKGNKKLNSVESIDYEQVTLNLSDYFLYATEVWRNDSDTTINSTLSIHHGNNFNGFNSEGEFVKCTSLDIDLSNHRYIKTISFHYNKTKLLLDWKELRISNDYVEAGFFGFKFHGKGSKLQDIFTAHQNRPKWK